MHTSLRMQFIAFFDIRFVGNRAASYVVSKYVEYSELFGLWNLLAQREGDRKREILGEDEAKSSRGTSIPASFVFSTIQFTPVHLHLRYFHSNSRGAIRSIFEIGTWLWKISCHFSLKRRNEKRLARTQTRIAPLVLKWASLSRNVFSKGTVSKINAIPHLSLSLVDT